LLYANWIYGSEDIAPARSVRDAVFVNEQGFSPESEYDAFDKTAWHLVAMDDEKPIATGRVYLDNGNFHLGRVCVLPEYRGFGVGDAIVRLLLNRALSAGAPSVTISAQECAKDFYKRYGFEEVGKTYTNPGETVPHVDLFAKSEDIQIGPSCGGNCAGCSGCGSAGDEEYSPEDDEE